ncbi:hypothetical protein [Thalassotalea sp. Y01]|uniref:hypothetical protein n=1 Tax=Thalassotalea sp. Y01 TaxID=2729613 RepID=UPI00145D27CA|nr:hypothetical protein [Thalassotalea sp. Y01]NMP16131.1 hypothetical protein [Thalassotalea sp. Y01]
MARPKGSKNRLTTAFHNKAKRALMRAANAACDDKNPDWMDALKIIAPFISRPRPHSEPIFLEIPENASAEQTADLLIREVCKGNIDPDSGSQLLSALYSASKFVELESLVEELREEIHLCQQYRNKKDDKETKRH